jgi:hypothetical protein
VEVDTVLIRVRATPLYVTVGVPGEFSVFNTTNRTALAPEAPKVMAEEV